MWFLQKESSLLRTLHFTKLSDLLHWPKANYFLCVHLHAKLMNSLIQWCWYPVQGHCPRRLETRNHNPNLQWFDPYNPPKSRFRSYDERYNLKDTLPNCVLSGFVLGQYNDINNQILVKRKIEQMVRRVLLERRYRVQISSRSNLTHVTSDSPPLQTESVDSSAKSKRCTLLIRDTRKGIEQV